MIDKTKQLENNIKSLAEMIDKQQDIIEYLNKERVEHAKQINLIIKALKMHLTTK